MAAPGSRSIINGSITVIQNHHGHMDGVHNTLKELSDHSAIGALYNSKERYDPPKCHPETREGIRQNIIDWTESKEPNLLWLYGSAGAGKSAIAQSTAESLALLQTLAASFFFSRTSNGSYQNSEERFVFTIALQLASAIPGFAPYIHEAIAKTPFIWGLSLASQTSILILEPLRKFCKMTHTTTTYPRVIVVDGLDECRSDSNAQVQVLEVLDSLSKPSAVYPFKVLVTSRPEYEIKAWFDPLLEADSDTYQLLQTLDLDSFSAVNDIRHFFLNEIAQIRQFHPLRRRIPTDWPSMTLIEEMVRRASGHFIYAATLIRYIKSLRHVPSKRLESILDQTSVRSDRPFADLDRLYLEVFRNAGELDVLRRLLSFHIVILQSSTTFTSVVPCEQDIAVFLSLPSSELDIFFMDLGSVIKYPTHVLDSLPYAFYHASMSDFLQDSSRSEELFVDVHRSREEYAVKALRQVYEVMERQDTSYPRLYWIWNVFWELFWAGPLTPSIKAELEHWDNMQNPAIEFAAQTLGFFLAQGRVVTSQENLVDNDEDMPLTRGPYRLHPACLRMLQNTFLGPLQSRIRAYRNCPDLPVELLALVAVWKLWDVRMVDPTQSYHALISHMKEEFQEICQHYPNQDTGIFDPFDSPSRHNPSFVSVSGWSSMLQFVYFWDISGPELQFSSKDFTAASIFFFKRIIRHFDSVLLYANIEDVNTEDTGSTAGLVLALCNFGTVLSRSSLSSDLAILIQGSRVIHVASFYCEGLEPSHNQSVRNSVIQLLKTYLAIFHDLSGLFKNSPSGTEDIDAPPGGISHQDLDEMRFVELMQKAGLGDKYSKDLELWESCYYHGL